MMMDNIDLENERAAIAMLLEAAAQIAEPPASAPEPVGDIDDLHALFEKQKQIGNQLAALKGREADLGRQLQSIREEAAELARQSKTIKDQAAQLFEALFGKPERQILPVAKPHNRGSTCRRTCRRRVRLHANPKSFPLGRRTQWNPNKFSTQVA